ncbi:MAG TPA: hypothetical protein VKV39_17020, partial [Candidatus Sulfotelmatobacter sp.]|nr:hypothetical protein [Candidatus Sulfotelmatobacter sp.]
LSWRIDDLRGAAHIADSRGYTRILSLTPHYAEQSPVWLVAQLSIRVRQESLTYMAFVSNS